MPLSKRDAKKLAEETVTEEMTVEIDAILAAHIKDLETVGHINISQSSLSFKPSFTLMQKIAALYTALDWNVSVNEGNYGDSDYLSFR